MGSDCSTLVENERETDDRWLAGRLTAPSREPGARLAAAAQLEEFLRARGVGSDPRLPPGAVARLRAGHAPLVHHVLALDDVTQAGIHACVRAFGYDLDDLPLLQSVLHRDRTVVVPTDTYDRERRVAWPAVIDEGADLSRGEFVPEIVSQFRSHLASEMGDAPESRFIHLRIGLLDTDIAPSVIPGSVVRVDTRDCGPTRFIERGQRRERAVYAVAHVRGLTCAYVDWIDDCRIALVTNNGAAPPSIYRLDDEAIVLGRVCAELRSMDVRNEVAACHRHDHCASRFVRPDADRQTVGAFLRSSREAIGMTHRDAHTISVRVADAYGDRRFAIGVGTLSDWESQRELPLSVPHVISLAVCYSVSFSDLLRASGRRPSYPASARSSTPQLDVPEMALFQPALLPAARLAASLHDLSWDDVFRCGDRATVYDRALVGARYVIVNRRIRRVVRTASSSIDRPLYVLSDECGRQICASCFVDRDHLYIQPDPHLALTIRAVPRDRIRIRGRVTAVLRCR